MDAKTLFEQIEAAGFYPDIVITEVERALADEDVLSGVVLPAMYFDNANLKRDLTVGVLTPSRLMLWTGTEDHAAEETDDEEDEDELEDEVPDEDEDGEWHHRGLLQVLSLHRIADVRSLTRIDNPEFKRGDLPDQVEVDIVLSSIDRFSFGAGKCDNCEDLHGHGEVLHDVHPYRVSKSGDGPEKVRQLLEFANAVSCQLAQ